MRESKVIKKEERKTGRTAWLQRKLPYGTPPKFGYLSLCSPTQELQQKVNVTVKKRETRLANMRSGDTGDE